MSSEFDEVAREQQYISMLYGRLDDLRARASGELTRVGRETAGTRQHLVERDVTTRALGTRLVQLDAAEDGLCFGRLDLDDDERHYIGRIGILDEQDDYEPLLVDWRAPAARAFYVATSAAPLGVRRRRHIHTRLRTVTGLDDDALGAGVLDAAGGAADQDETPHLVGEAALLAALTSARTGRMRDVVETIQAEQDAVIRDRLPGVLVVQGGPGTGKTAVALHRAAYLLYTHRERLARRGVLIVGPNPTFLRYISHVLPALGETSAALLTVGELFPGVRARRPEAPAVAEIKGRAVMAEVLEAAIRNRRRLPERDRPLDVVVDGVVYKLDHETCLRAQEKALATDEPHNIARPVFVNDLLDALTDQAVERLSHDPFEELTKEILEEIAKDLEDHELELEGGESLDASLTSGPDRDELRHTLEQEPAVAQALDLLWPDLTPQRLLSELFADPAALAEAAPQLTAEERALLFRRAAAVSQDTVTMEEQAPEPWALEDWDPEEWESEGLPPEGPAAPAPAVDESWSIADVSLLDEAAELLGAFDAAAAAAQERRRRQEIAYAQGVLDVFEGSRSTDLEDEREEIITVGDILDAETLADFQSEWTERTVAERAVADRTWTFGHVIVDEAQELSAMAWRLLMRRCPAKSMTLVGDVAQTGDLAGARNWEQTLAPFVGDRWRLAELTVNYRTPKEIMTLAADVLRRIDPEATPPRSVRESGVEPYRETVPAARLAERLGRLAREQDAAVGEGKLAVIVPARSAPELSAAVLAAVPEAAAGEEPDLERRTVLLTARQAKGLEFDAVVLADPDAIAADGPRGENDLYVALTRSTGRLLILDVAPAPER
ncbi:MAG TPA: ATP-binding domain-containing protein [Actinospica sp.]|nr:ATP-binding domain-containing protein [Actinospica sp.]